MGEAPAAEAGELSYAYSVVQKPRLAAQTVEAGVLRTDGYPARRLVGGTAGASEGITQPDSDMFS